jgi:hypothetical protein
MSGNIMQIVDLAHCENCTIKHRGLCSAASPEALAELSLIANPHHYATGQTIILEGVPVDFVANVVSGIVKLTKTMLDGRQQIRERCRTVLPEPQVIRGDCRSASRSEAAIIGRNAR